MSREAFFQLRFTEQEKRVYEDAAGPRRLSAWIREACREKLARTSTTLTVDDAPLREGDPPPVIRTTKPSVPAPRRPSPGGRPANHHVRCSCPRCSVAA